MKKIILTFAATVFISMAGLTGCSSPTVPEPSEMMDSETIHADTINADTIGADTDTEPEKPASITNEMPKILFVGNSHTYSNDLPGTFWEIATALGQECDVYELSEGGYYLEQFADPEDALGAVLDQTLTQEPWDFVILQENTNAAIISPIENGMLPFARTLDEKISMSGGRTALLMTWAPEDGLDNGLVSLSRDEIQSMLADNYSAVAGELDCLMIPAGTALTYAADLYPELALWDEDGLHPSYAGTYLAACTVYALLFQDSPGGCSYTGELDADTALKLQAVAAELALE